MRSISDMEGKTIPVQLLDESWKTIEPEFKFLETDQGSPFWKRVEGIPNTISKYY